MTPMRAAVGGAAVRVRPAEPGDAAALARVHVAGWRAAYRGILPDEVLAGLAVASFEERWSGYLTRETRVNLVAERAGEVIGFVAFGPAHRTPEDAHEAGREAEVYGLYVAPADWGTGAGRALWLAAAAALRERGHRSVFLWVFGANGRARRFYERAGFRLVEGSARTLERFGAGAAEVQYRLTLG